MKCPKCGFADAAGKFCSECGGKLSASAAAPAVAAPAAPTEELKTATILFGQRVPEAVLTRARALADGCDLFLVVGSSLQVTPAAALPRLALMKDAPLIIINLQPTPLDDYADVILREKAGVALPPIVAALSQVWIPSEGEGE